MASVLIYGTHVCGYCRRAETLFTRKGVAFEKVLVDEDPERLAEMVKRSGRRTVPQIFIGDKHIGGYIDLVALDSSGELEELLSGA